MMTGAAFRSFTDHTNIALKSTGERNFALHGIIIVSVLATFIADLQTDVGIAVWITYIIPLKVVLLGWRPRVSIYIAAVITLLMIIGFYLDYGDPYSKTARLNRGLGIFSVWVMGTVGYFFIRNKVAVRTEEWIKSGQARLGEILQGDQDLNQLGTAILRFLVEYTGACAGVIYLNRKNKFMRIAAYGVDLESTPEVIEPNDGLLGRVATDRRPLLLRDVPEGYLTYGSAFGKGTPRNLLIAPGMSGGKSVAMLELGFSGDSDMLAVELTERISESMAAAINSAEYQQNLEYLLRETRKQAVALQSQEEQLRVSNEELEQQARTLQESQAQLEQQQSELEQTNSQLEEQTQKLEVQQEELENAKGKLQLRARELAQASQYKSDFLANMSHELRTPLNSTLILAKLLADNGEGNLTDEQVRYAETIQSSGNDLLNLINDILDLSKIEAGHMQIEPQPLNVQRLAENLTRVFEPQAREKALEFNVNVHESCPAEIETDHQRLDQVLKNLLSNAIKFTHHGKVLVEIKKTPLQKISIAVSDTGIGISDDDKELIFDAFRQADGTTNRKFGGTGLGLSISRELTRLLGGQISLESTSGKGSTFSVIIPEKYSPNAVQPRQVSAREQQIDVLLSPAPAPTPKKPRPAHPRLLPFRDDRDQLTPNKRLILVIEDDVAFARILYDIAHENGFQCVVETMAEDGVRACHEFTPNAVVLDVGLPDTSGLSVLDRIKQSPETRHIPVHMVSVEDYTHKALTLGAVGYLLKPVKREEITKALKQMEERFSRDLKRLLIVEDDKVQREGLEKLLSSPEVETVGVGSTQECLEKLRGETFDCMVLDLGLPDCSGHKLLQTLSEEEAYSFPPVIVYTGKDISPAEEQQLRRYSNSIIIKGAKSPERLVDEVTLFLHQIIAELPKNQQTLLKKARNRDAVIEGRRILVVEDDIRNVYSLTSILEPRGAIIHIARNGREALEVLDKGTPVDLVLMDVMMPEMDGITATRKIRENPAYRKLPIIMLTAKAMKGDQKRCLDAGGNDYMAKPLDVEKLLSLIRVWMPR